MGVKFDPKQVVSAWLSISHLAMWFFDIGSLQEGVGREEEDEGLYAIAEVGLDGMVSEGGVADMGWETGG